MRKIISLFQRNYDGDRLVRNEVTPGAEWVLAGEGVATRKFDGTCCLIRGWHLFKRYDAKQGRTPPPGFEPAQGAPDPVTGHWPGWLPVTPSDTWHMEADETLCIPERVDGTFELCGPKINGNPERLTHHCLIRHGTVIYHDVPLTFDGIKEWLQNDNIEGLVWHHPDGRMVKIKGKDFGIKRHPIKV